MWFVFNFSMNIHSFIVLNNLRKVAAATLNQGISNNHIERGCVHNGNV